MTNRFSLKYKVIIVTGATGIPGYSFIKALAEEGAKIWCVGKK
ncbi:MAG: hypothetical protein ACR2KZ_09705 [Segetibacter sp.]